MTDLALKWDGARADFSLKPTLVERVKYGLLFAGAGGADAGDVLDVGTGDFSLELDVRPDSLSRVQPIAGKSGAVHCLAVPGASGAHYASATMAPVTGDLDVRVHAAAFTWVTGDLQALIAQWGTSAGDRAWALYMVGSSFVLAVNNTVSYVKAIPGAFVDRTARWLRVTLDLDNGSGNSVATWYHSADGVSWTLIGTTNGAVQASLAASSAPVLVGSRNGAEPLRGKVFHAEVRSGIDGTRRAVFDADDFELGASSAASAVTGETWTLSGRAAIRADGTYWLSLPGTAGAFATATGTTPDFTELQILLQAQTSDWSPGTRQTLASGGSWRLDVEGAVVTLAIETDVGATEFSWVPPLVDGTAYWILIQAALYDTGAGTATADLNISTDGINFSGYGTSEIDPLTIGSLVGASAPRVGADSSGGRRFVGEVYRCEIAYGIGGTPALSFDAAEGGAGGISWTSGLVGETWTVGGAASVQASVAGGWSLFFDAGGALRLRLLDAAGKSAAGQLAASGAWAGGELATLAVTVDRDGLATCYKNGAAVGTLSVAGAQGSLSSAANFLLAQRPDGAVGFVGLLDEGRVYLGRLLSASDVLAHQRGVRADESSLAAFWDCDEGSGSTAYDQAGAGRHLALTGSPAWAPTGTAVIATGGADLELDEGLEAAVLISLFTDRRAAEGDVLPDNGDDRRGWWGDALPVVAGDQVGSKLWLLRREKQTQAALGRAAQYARESLAWLVEDQVATSVAVTATAPAPGVLQIDVAVQRPRARPVQYRYSAAWDAQAAVGG